MKTFSFLQHSCDRSSTQTSALPLPDSTPASSHAHHATTLKRIPDMRAEPRNRLINSVAIITFVALFATVAPLDNILAGGCAEPQFAAARVLHSGVMNPKSVAVGDFNND